MRIAIVHYHLIRGGVTSVIKQQARSLIEGGDDVLVIAGEAVGGENTEAPTEFGGAPLAVVPDLRYDPRREDFDSVSNPLGEERLASSILAAMERHWGGAADVLHVHNPLIRKNCLLLGALRNLKDRGLRLLLQNHDFAEDFRPDVYLPGNAYVDDVHYAAINGRDHSFLRRAGLDPLGTHLLPNAVTAITATPDLDRTRYLYPVRAIRRKNIGEALLLSLFIPQGRTVAVTLPPTSARDEAQYDHWQRTAVALELPVEFGIGESASFSDLYGSAFCVLTTSIKEGFGFSFLEPWTAGRAVIGRRLDYVCRDFERSGLYFDSLYDSISIPLVYLPAPQLRRKLEAALVDAYAAFGLSVPQYAIKTLTDDIFSRDVFDFGRLDEELQTEVLEMVASNPAARDDIAEVNPFLAGLAEWVPDESVIVGNRDRALEMYAPSVAMRRLRDTYLSVLERPVRHRLSKSLLLELFLDPLKLSLIGLGHD